MNKRFFTRALRLSFYVCLDAATGTIIYAVSFGEAGLAPGQLAIRILTAMALASAIVGGPDIMLYWQESGRRIAAEEGRDAAQEERDAAQGERDAAQGERDAAQQKLAARDQEIAELRALLSDLREQVAAGERRPRRRARRHLRDSG